MVKIETNSLLYTHTHTLLFTQAFTCMLTQPPAHLYASTDAGTRICILIKYARTRTHARTHMNAQTCAHIQFTHTHTHTHARHRY